MSSQFHGDKDDSDVPMVDLAHDVDPDGTTATNRAYLLRFHVFLTLVLFPTTTSCSHPGAAQIHERVCVYRQREVRH